MAIGDYQRRYVAAEWSPGKSRTNAWFVVKGKREYRGSARVLLRQEAYQRLEEIDARRLHLAGQGVTHIAGRASTTTHHVRRWLKETAAHDAGLAVTIPENTD
jgi:hypothetical protein